MKNFFAEIEKIFVNSMKVRVLAFSIIGLFTIISLFLLGRSLTSVIDLSEPIPLVRYEQSGYLDYAAYLKPNSLYETEQLGPGQVYFTRLLEGIRAKYHYVLWVDQDYEDLLVTYQVTAEYGIQDTWKKEFVLVPPTQTNESEFEFEFAVPVNEALEWGDIFMKETGVKLTSPDLVLNVLISPEINTIYGPVKETFEHEISVQIDSSEVRFIGEEEQYASGRLTGQSTANEEDLQKVRRQRVWASISFLVWFLLLLVISWMQARIVLSKSRLEKDFIYAQKRLGGLFVRTKHITPVIETEEVIRLSSLKDLVNLADETLRPVLYTLDQEGNLNFVILRLGYVRYEYVTDEKLESEEEFTDLQEHQRKHSPKGDRDDGKDRPKTAPFESKKADQKNKSKK